jgi:hypothetical protein
VIALNKRWHSVREGRQIRPSGPNRILWRMCARPCCGDQRVPRSSWLISSYPRERAVLDDCKNRAIRPVPLCWPSQKGDSDGIEGQALNWLECRLLPPEMAESVRRRPSHDRVLPSGTSPACHPRVTERLLGLARAFAYECGARLAADTRDAIAEASRKRGGNLIDQVVGASARS